MTRPLTHLDEDRRSPRAETAQHSVYHALLYTVFQQPQERDSAGVVIALSSTNPGEGVTYVTKALVRELARCEFSAVAGINTRFLRKLREPTMEAFRRSLSGPAP